MTTELVSDEYWFQLQVDNLVLVTSIVPRVGRRIWRRTFHFGTMRDFGLLFSPEGYIPPITPVIRDKSIHALVNYFRDIIDSTAYYNELKQHENADKMVLSMMEGKF